MSKIDELLEEMIESQVDSLVQEDSYYKMFETPLKPAASFKKAHRKQLVDFFKLTDLRQQLEKAPDLILSLIPEIVTPKEFEQIKNELDHSGEHFVRYMESVTEEPSDKPILFQEIFGLSDDTLLRIYDLGRELVKTAKYEQANTLFVFLTTMAPHVTSYWIAQGATLQALDQHEEAIAVFKAAKFLSPQDPAPSAYIIESHLMLQDEDLAKLELSELKEIIKSLDKESQAKWLEKIKQLVI